MRTDTTQEELAHSFVTKIANLFLFPVPIAVYTHQLVQQGPLFVHDDFGPLLLPESPALIMMPQTAACVFAVFDGGGEIFWPAAREGTSFSPSLLSSRAYLVRSFLTFLVVPLSPRQPAITRARLSSLPFPEGSKLQIFVL